MGGNQPARQPELLRVLWSNGIADQSKHSKVALQATVTS